jgi:hypothetical protein
MPAGLRPVGSGRAETTPVVLAAQQSSAPTPVSKNALIAVELPLISSVTGLVKTLNLDGLTELLGQSTDSAGAGLLGQVQSLLAVARSDF